MSMERRSNHRLIAAIVGAILIIGIITMVVVINKAPSCGDSEELKDGKCVTKIEVDAYTYEHTYEDKGNKRLKLTVEVPKNLGYVCKENDTKIELYNETDRSTISIYLLLASKNSITMKESDYSKSAWTGYKSTDIDGDNKIVEINKIRSNGSVYGVEWSRTFGDVYENYWSGVRVQSQASGFDQGKDSSFDGKDYKTFRAREIYDSADYQYLLNSIKIEVE